MRSVSSYLSKRVIYIDQFALSYMVRALYPGMKATGNNIADQFWVKLYQKLDKLIKLQIIICPQSNFHLQESIVSNFFKPLEKMVHLLSRGLKFIDQDQIKNLQIQDSVRNWLKDLSGSLSIDTVRTVIKKEINTWLPRNITFRHSYYPSAYEDELRNLRGRIHQEWISEFYFWKENADVKFEQWTEDFYLSFVKEILNSYPHCLRYRNYVSIPPIHHVNLCRYLLESIDPILLIHSVFQEEGIAHSDLLFNTCQYLQSGFFRQIPVIKLYSLFYASFARKAGSGQKKPPGQGITNDLNMLSLLLPYCDAMFIDNQCRGCLEEKDVQDHIDYSTRIFSLTNKDEFLEYLEQLEKEFPTEYREKAVELYGEEWINTPTKLYRTDEVWAREIKNH